MFSGKRPRQPISLHTKRFEKVWQIRGPPTRNRVPTSGCRETGGVATLGRPIGDVRKELVTMGVQPGVEETHDRFPLGNQGVVQKSEYGGANGRRSGSANERSGGAVPDGGKYLSHTGDIRVSTTCDKGTSVFCVRPVEWACPGYHHRWRAYLIYCRSRSTGHRDSQHKRSQPWTDMKAGQNSC